MTKKEILKQKQLERRKRILHNRFRSTKWNELFSDVIFEGDPEWVKEENEKLNKLYDQFVIEYGDLLNFEFEWKKYFFKKLKDYCADILHEYYEAIVGNRRFRIALRGNDKRSACLLLYAVHLKNRWSPERVVLSWVPYHKAVQIAEAIILHDNIITKNAKLDMKIITTALYSK